MVLIGLGANLPSPDYGSPRQTLEAAIGLLGARGVAVAARSRWYESAPLPSLGPGGIALPWYINGVMSVTTPLTPESLLAVLHEVERKLGRRRRRRWESRVADLDLLAHGNHVQGCHWRPDADPEQTLTLPHPRLHERSFVLLPLAEIAPDWCHPALDLDVAALIAGLDQPSIARPLAAR